MSRTRTSRTELHGNRREWMQIVSAGALGASFSGWIEHLAAAMRATRATRGMHPAVDERRAKPDGYVRP